MRKNRRIPTPRAQAARAAAPVLAFLGLLVAWGFLYVAPRDQMIWCGLNHDPAGVLSCQDRVYQGWALGKVLSGGVSPSEAARTQRR